MLSVMSRAKPLEKRVQPVRMITQSRHELPVGFEVARDFVHPSELELERRVFLEERAPFGLVFVRHGCECT